MSKYLKMLPLILVSCVASMPGYADLLVRNRFQKELSGEPAPAPPTQVQNSEASWGSPLNSDGSPVQNSGKGSGTNSGNDGSNGASAWGGPGHGGNTAKNGGKGAGANSEPDVYNNAAEWGGPNRKKSDGSAGKNSEPDGYNSAAEWGGPNRKKSDGSAGKNSEPDGYNSAAEWGGPNRKKSDGSAGKNSEPDVYNNAAEWGGPNRRKSDGNTAKNSDKGSGSNSGDGTNGETAWGGNGNQYNQNFPPLTNTDEKMMPDPNPPGMPVMPSKCAENSDCKPCYAEANAALNKQRMNLEKVRAIYDYTHRFTSEGLDFMNGAAAAGGGIAQMGAAAETKKVNGALDEFDATVRSKNKELLGELQKGLQKMAVCEADYFDNDDWYMRYGEVYFQFMQARYSN